MTDVQLIIPDSFGRGAVAPRPDAFLDTRLAGETMGTTWSARWIAPPGLPGGRVQGEIEVVFAAMIGSMSPWEPDSLISRFNRLRQGKRMDVDPAFSIVLALALDIARRSEGAFDPCLGGEVMRRGFGAVGVGAGIDGSVSGAEAWTSLLAGPQELFQPGGVTLDLSGVAKGYAVDWMAEVLGRLGVSQFLVEIGGEFVARGVKPDGMPWWVDLENPYPDGPPWRLALVDGAVATSGDYRQVREIDGARVSHIVPAAGRVSESGDLACVSVLHESCAAADAWATALFAAGDTEGLRLAEAEKLAALFQYRDAPARGSSCLMAMLD